MSDVLKKICDAKRVDVKHLQSLTSFSTMDQRARSSTAPRAFSDALRRRVSAGQTGFITEIKKASPSAGLIRDPFDPAALAAAYAEGGSTCLSVLTEEHDFKGSNEHLQQAKAACSLPVLRKDFMLTIWQVAESRAIGADCILLIMAALEDNQAEELHAAAVDYKMDVLIEIHDRTELDRALRLPSGMIGINNRNLKSLTVDLTTTATLAPLIPDHRLKVSESGIKSPEDVDHIRKAGVHCFLVGESLLKEPDVEKALKTLRAV